jgi:hypothetical protein
VSTSFFPLRTATGDEFKLVSSRISSDKHPSPDILNIAMLGSRSRTRCTAVFVDDHATGQTMYGYVMDSCADNNYWCQDDRYHLDISKPYLDSLGLSSTWNGRRVTWSYVRNAPAGYVMVLWCPSRCVTIEKMPFASRCLRQFFYVEDHRGYNPELPLIWGVQIVLISFSFFRMLELLSASIFGDSLA